MPIPQIFDWRLTRAQAHRVRADAFLTSQLAERLAERLQGLAAVPRRVALFGPLPPPLQAALPQTEFLPAMIAHDGRLCVEPACEHIADLGRLTLVNDLPGALAQIRATLPEQGGFFGIGYGGASLYEVRRALLAAESALTDGANPRLHPQLTAESGLQLLQRAGFAQPVADRETIVVRYPDLPALACDLRAAGLSNQLHARPRGVPPRALFAAAEAAWRGNAPKPEATFEIIALTGWKTAPA